MEHVSSVFCLWSPHFYLTYSSPQPQTKFKVSVLQYSYKSVSEQFIIYVDRKKKMHYPRSNFEEKKKLNLEDA